MSSERSGARGRAGLAGSRARAVLAAPATPAASFLLVLVLLALALRPDLCAVEWRDGRWFGFAIDVLQRSVPVMLLALGTLAVIGSGGVDLSVGTTMVIAGSGAALLLRDSGWPVPVVVIAALGGGLLLGLWNGTLVAGLRLVPIVATLVLYTTGRGIAQVWTAGQIVPVRAASFTALASTPIAGLPPALWIGAAAAVVLALVMRRTLFGLQVEALGDNERAAWLAGVPRGFVLLGCYAIAGLYAALAGLLVCADLRAADPANLGAFLELDAILAVVLGGGKLGGGRTSVLGAVLGAILLQALTNTLVATGIGYEAALAAKALAVLLLSAARSPRLREILLARTRRRA